MFLQLLTERAGYQCITGENGAEALDLASNRLPDLIILDIYMPDLNGLEVLSKLKSIPLTSAIPVIILSAYGGTDGS